MQLYVLGVWSVKLWMFQKYCLNQTWSLDGCTRGNGEERGVLHRRWWECLAGIVVMLRRWWWGNQNCWKEGLTRQILSNGAVGPYKDENLSPSFLINICMGNVQPWSWILIPNSISDIIWLHITTIIYVVNMYYVLNNLYIVLLPLQYGYGLSKCS